MAQEEYSFVYRSLLWECKGSLCGEIVPAFRGIAIAWNKNTIHIYFYIDGEISTNLDSHCTSIAAEIVASYSHATIHEHLIRLDYPTPLPKHEYWVYRRKELDVFETSIESYDDLPLLALKSTLGKISSSIRGIYLNVEEFYFYVDGPMTADLEEDFINIVNQFKKLSKKDNVAKHVFRIDIPQKLPDNDNHYNWVYKRKEMEL